VYILEYLERKYPCPSLVPQDDDLYLRAKLLQLLGERIMESTLTVVFEVIFFEYVIVIT
jgi:glutathione S-transferase